MTVSLGGALSSYSFYTHSIKEKFLALLASLTPLQKKVALVAIAVLSGCAVIYFSCRSWRAKKLEAGENDLSLDPHPARNGSQPLSIKRSKVVERIQKRRRAAPTVIVLPTDMAERKQEEKKSEKTIGAMLAANRQSARQQQKWEKSKGFTVGKGAIPPKVNGKFIANRGEEGRGKYSYVQEVGVASCQGIRSTMEDEDLTEHSVFEVNGRSYPFDIFGVFDGHGGRGVSTFVKKNLVAYFKAALANKNQEELTDEGIIEALKECFQNLHNNCKSAKEEGSVVIVSVLLNNKIWIANAGDSRAVLVKGDGVVMQGSEDAKPQLPKFRQSIEKLGGRVLEDKEEENPIPRVEGKLAVGRAIGDHHITGPNGQCCISPEPEITSFDLQLFRGGFLLLACDGLFDVASTDDAGKAIIQMNKRDESAQDMAKRFVHRAIEHRSQDNVSAIVVKF